MQMQARPGVALTGADAVCCLQGDYNTKYQGVGLSLEKRVTNLEDRVDVLEKDSRALAIAQAETCVYIKQILQKLENWEARIITLCTQQNPDHPANEGADADRWLAVIKEISKITIYVVGAILAAKIFIG
jgi:Cft2 family RNA processing exonuclease